METQKKLVAAHTDFALDLFHRLTATLSSPSNAALSPVSIHAAIALLAAGARGPTLVQLLAVLRSPTAGHLHRLSADLASFVLADGSGAGGPRLCFSGGVWVEKSLSLKPEFAEVAVEKYMAEAKAVDFLSKADDVRREVNCWVEKVTTGLIKELLPVGSVDHRTKLVLGNALYYKGAWEHKFDASKTKESDFHLLNGTSVQAPFMTSKKKQFLSEYDGFKVLRLPYEQGEDQRQFSMYIFLPNAQDGLSNLQEKLRAGSVFLEDHRPLSKVRVGNFKLPKFKITFGFEASEVLNDLGLILPFSSDGDLTGMVDSPQGGSLHVSSIFHKSVVEVNEEGTEAAATTAVVMMAMCLRIEPDPLDFEADHPFVFLIREDTTGVVLFVGHLLNPLTDA